MPRPLPFPPPQLQFGDVLQRLALLSPKDLRAIEVLARMALERAWPKPPRPSPTIRKHAA